MSGHKQLLSVTIDREAMDPEDPEMLQDLILSAVNEATRKVDDAMKSQLGDLTGGMPGLFG
jgi:DNA-binding YbaB/EbfC family protein